MHNHPLNTIGYQRLLGLMVETFSLASTYLELKIKSEKIKIKSERIRLEKLEDAFKYREIRTLDGISEITKGNLEDAGVYYVHQLISKTETDLLKMKASGRKSLREIKSVLKDHGFTLLPYHLTNESDF